MTRMHMWGAGTAFPDFESFLESMKKRWVTGGALSFAELAWERRQAPRVLDARWPGAP